MRRIMIVALLAAGLGGCASAGLPSFSAITTGISLATKSVANPVTKTEEAQIELAGDTILQAMKVYKRACIAGTADKNCRANIAQVQAYTRQVPPLIAQLRTFVDKNDQINATVIYNQLSALYVNVKGAAASLGINLGGVS